MSLRKHKVINNFKDKLFWHYNGQHWVSKYFQEGDCCHNKMYDDEEHLVLLYASFQYDFTIEGETISIEPM